jgi:hypothetical protein
MPKRTWMIPALVLAAVLLNVPAVVSGAQPEDDWKAEFADICSKTDDPMALPKPEIRKLIERCDKLKPRIEQLDESARKVYLKRLQMCRELFVFVLETPATQP